jgi:thiosulfate dehydrogenase (quinone) large subunit
MRSLFVAVFRRTEIQRRSVPDQQRKAKVPEVFSHSYQLKQVALTQLRHDLASEQIMLVPLRLFIGLGWLRTGVEKLVDPGWLNGASLTDFFARQIGTGQIVFPFYEGLIHTLFLPHALLLSWIVLVGQLLAGLAIMLGACTRAALLGGLWMNLNFLLAGVPNPSAFYLVIQIVLLVTRSGTVLGLDGWLAQHPDQLRAANRKPIWLYLLLITVFVGAASSALAYVHDFSPAGSVHDGAMLLVIVSLLAAAWAGLGLLRRVLVVPPGS